MEEKNNTKITAVWKIDNLFFVADTPEEALELFKKEQHFSFSVMECITPYATIKDKQTEEK